MKRAIAIIALLLAVPSPVSAQKRPYVLGGNEFVAGAALNIALRTPIIAPAFRRPVPRFVVAQGISVAYEYFIDTHAWNAPGHEPWRDIGERAAGYLVTEGAIWLIRKAVK